MRPESQSPRCLSVIELGTESVTPALFREPGVSKGPEGRGFRKYGSRTSRVGNSSSAFMKTAKRYKALFCPSVRETEKDPVGL